jgi:hypothetical protein
MIPGSANPLLLKSAAAAAGGYQIERSLRFNSSDSAYLSRTPSSAGNRRTWTFSCWVKRATTTAAYPTIFGGNVGTGSNRDFIRFLSDQLDIAFNDATGGNIRTTAVFRDYSAWYHIVIAVDTTQATASSRVKVYINGTEQTAFAVASYPAQNYDTLRINNTNQNTIGADQNYSDGYFSGYFADVHFIDGQALTPSSFTEVSATTGQLIPKAYTGSFGTNGFWLKFSDNSAATATTLGKDYSGNSNNWTPNNLSVTAGAGNDSLVDTPTSYGTDTYVGGEVRGNYCTFNPIARSGITNATLANGNLDISGTGSSYTGCLSTFAVNSGKWYYEFTVTNAPNSSTGGGIVSADSINQANGGNAGFGDCSGGYFRVSGVAYNNGSAIATGLSSIGTNDVLNVAFDLDAGKIWFGKNGTWDSSGNPAAGTGAVATFTPGGRSFYIFAQGFYNSGTWSGSLNTGARPFAYTAPSGFKALVDTNLTAPVVAKPNTVFDAKLYTGNAGNQTISGFSFSPDFIWTKSRSQAYSHNVYDSVRGISKNLFTNETSAENTDANTIKAFNSDGFQLGSNDNGNYTNGGSAVAWAWDAGSSTVTNTQGSITSQVRANASAGFSIVSVPGYTYPTKTAGHGLGVEPHFIITKNRGVSNPWIIYHKAAGANTYFQFDTGAGYTGVPGVWSGVNSSVFPINSGVNQQTDIIAYCFAPVAGYSSFGSYTGNGSADGPFVYTGFRPRWIMVKASSTTGTWVIHDTARGSYNASTSVFYANDSMAEYTDPGMAVDINSNGFKVRTGTSSNTNSSSVTYLYCAFAESPFQFSRAR